MRPGWRRLAPESAPLLAVRIVASRGNKSPRHAAVSVALWTARWGGTCMPPCIEGRNVNLTFRPPNRRPVCALHGFDIDVQESEFLSIVGPSGCGKSTFLNVLLGLLKPDSGDLRIRGKPI